MILWDRFDVGILRLASKNSPRDKNTSLSTQKNGLRVECGMDIVIDELLWKKRRVECGVEIVIDQLLWKMHRIEYGREIAKIIISVFKFIVKFEIYNYKNRLKEKHHTKNPDNKNTNK